VLKFFQKLCHYFASNLQVFASLFFEFESPNIHRESKKLKVGPTSRTQPILTQNFQTGVK